MQEKGDEKSWNTMLARYTNEKNAQEKGKLLGGLGKLNHNTLLKMLAKEFLKLANIFTISAIVDFSLLAYIREPWIIKQFLNLAKNETVVRSQDYFTVLTHVSRNTIGKYKIKFQ